MSQLLRPLHIAIIDPAVRVPELDNFNRLSLAAPEVCFSFHVPALFGMQSLRLVPQKPDAIIVFGSGASVYDNLPWQAELHPYLEEQMLAPVPILGICYGHQALAHLLGGKIRFQTEERIKTKGLRAVQFTKKGFWGESGLEAQYIVSHAEEVYQLPSDCEIFAQSPACACEGFMHTQLPVWGIQSHPEAGPDFINNQNIRIEASEKPFTHGQEFMRRFISFLLQERIQ